MRSLTNQDVNSPFKIHYSTFERSDIPKSSFRILSLLSRLKKNGGAPAPPSVILPNFISKGSG